ncbi:phosphatase PAP2 family protein [Glycomyces salinus]|uniref:phosphatase PAP2 family protein n=1 Tax=Glycomyces salinus TaxID=980294 RepID=UPI0018EDA326|nr:phosphatase PAP2 family protein [Glycomyces salinus]
MPSERSTTTRRSAGIRDRGVTVPDDAVVDQLVRPLRRYIPVGWFDWEPYGKRPKSWWPDLWLFTSFLAMAALLTWPSPLIQFDWAVRMWAIDYRIESLRPVAESLAQFGQARVVAPVTLGFAVWCSLRSRSIRPLLMYVLSFITLAAILGMKYVLGRPLSLHPFQLRDVSPDGALLFTYFPEGGGGNINEATAFPSGHAVNSVLLFGLIVMLIGGLIPKTLRWGLIWVPPIAVFSAQVFYLGQHWFSDEPAGIILGLLIIRSAQRVAWHEIPLGPLKVFEPATRKTILISTLLILWVMGTPLLPLNLALVSAVLVVATGLGWLLLSRREARRREEEEEAAEIPSQQSDSSQ